MTASGLRRESARGRLVVERIAGKDYTTLANIERMRELCRVEAKVPGCGSESAADEQRIGSSETGVTRKARAVLHTILSGQNEHSPPTSPANTSDALRRSSRDPDQIPIADVLTVYLTDIVPGHSRPKETKGRIAALDSFFGDRMLSYVTGETCRTYAAQRSTDAAARRELEDLRAAINHHRREGLCSKVVEVVLPHERPPRERWLNRSEAARLIWSAWRYREVQKGRQTDRRSRQHVARFILVALYTGTRASAVCGAALQATVGHGWVDLDRGCSTVALQASVRRINASRPFLCPINSWRIYGAGNGAGSGSPSNGTEIRCRAWTRRSPTS